MDSHPRIEDELGAGMEGIRALARSLIVMSMPSTRTCRRRWSRQAKTAPAVVDVAIAKEGYATESLGHLQEDRHVVLRPGIPIGTTISGITVAPPGTTLTISSLREIEQHPESVWWPEDSAPLTPGAPTTLRVCEPGVFELLLEVRIGDGWGQPLLRDRIETRDVERPDSLLLHVPPGRKEEALRQRPK
jgi:hypothetical protein